MSGGRRCCVVFLALAAAAVLGAFFPQGVARNVELVRLRPPGNVFLEVSAAETGGQLAETTMSATDYDEPGANTNPWAGWATPPPPPPPPTQR